jgi:CDP-4-dehydro-6-deoxyglucose reductase
MPFTVTVQPSGKTFSVERDEPILQAAIRQGIGLPYGCRDGACGSCKCRMLEGRVIHGAHQQ